MILKVFVFLVFLGTSQLFAQNIKFAPLPKEKAETLEKDYKPFLAWLSKETGDEYELVMSVDYPDLVNKIKSGEIDIAYLGPLPYALIRQHTDSVIPIVKFLDKKANSSYTCSIVVQKNSGIKSVKELHGKKISLPQKYSTCGYYSASIAYAEQNLEVNNYSFDGNHANVALSVLLGESNGGSLQTTYFDKYAYLGLEKIYESGKLPGFLLAANKQKLSNEKITQIKNTITKLSPLSNEKDKKTTQNWGETIRYGATLTTEQEYADVVKKLKNMAVLK